MTLQLSFQGVYHYAQFAPRIRIPLEIVGQNIPYRIEAVLDTGAFISIFNCSILGSIGINDVTTGRAMPFESAEGRTAQGFIHDVQIAIWGTQLTIPVGFVPTWPDVSHLLGMEGFLEQVLIAIEHGRRNYYV